MPSLLLAFRFKIKLIEIDIFKIKTEDRVR